MFPTIATRYVTLGFQHLPRDIANVIARKPMFDPNIEILRKMYWTQVNFDIDFLGRYWCYKPN